MSECARCSERLSIEDTCLRAHPGEWTHKTCCAPEHEESDLETAQAELADREDLMEMAQQEMDRLRGMNKRLRAALAETRAAGDALAHQATELTIYLQGVPNVGSSRSRLSAWIEQWRSVRGDTPTDGFETTDTVSVPPKSTQNAGHQQQPANSEEDGRRPQRGRQQHDPTDGEQEHQDPVGGHR